MAAPSELPIGLSLTVTTRELSRACDSVLREAGGSLVAWQILLTLKRFPYSNQTQLAAQVGLQGATLTHHLNSMEAQGWLLRQRAPHNRRVHQLSLTGAGEAAFQQMRPTISGFDQRLRRGLSEQDIATLHRLLVQLSSNIRNSEAPES